MEKTERTCGESVEWESSGGRTWVTCPGCVGWVGLEFHG